MNFEEWLKEEERKGNLIVSAWSDEAVHAMRTAWQAGYNQGYDDGVQEGMVGNIQPPQKG